MEIDPTVLSLIISVATLIIAISVFWRRGIPITAENFVGTLQEAQGTATEIATIVQAAVFAAEQLKATGQLPDNNAAFDYAYRHAKKLLPTLEKDTLEMWIESFVPLANQMINRDGVPPMPKPAPKPSTRIGLTGLEG